MKISTNAPLAQFTSLRAGGPAENLIEIEDGDDLKLVITEHAKNGPLWILGYGTNCLISDKGLPGTVLLNRSGALSKVNDNTYTATSGYDWDRLIQAAVSDGLWGLEFTSGIPGGVGAAITGNIAAYGHKIADRFVKATVLNTKDGSTEIWDAQKAGFDYRSSNFQLPENKHLVILDATFSFSHKPTSELEYESALRAAADIGVKPDSLENRRKVIMEARRRAGSLLSGPATGFGTAGSFFKNPIVSPEQAEKIVSYDETKLPSQQLLRQNLIHGQSKSRVSAAHVLLAAGFARGQTWGQVRLHPDHILKVENMGSASAQEIYDVVQEIIISVKQKLDIDLEPEVKFIGDF